MVVPRRVPKEKATGTQIERERHRVTPHVHWGGGQRSLLSYATRLAKDKRELRCWGQVRVGVRVGRALSTNAVNLSIHWTHDKTICV